MVEKKAVNPVNNLNLKDRQALLLYLGIVLLCAICFAIGIAVGRATTSAADTSTAGTIQPSATRPPRPPVTPGR